MTRKLYIGSGRAVELFVGNVPPNCTQQGLAEFLNAALHQVKLVDGPGDPILSARLSNKFAFVTFRSVEECTKAINASGVPFMGNHLKIQRPSSYRGPPDQCVTWQVLTGQVSPDSVVGVTIDPNTKISRELFVGNVPQDTQGSALIEFLGTAMGQVGLTTAPGNPIINVRMNSRFCFLEFRSVEECQNALNMNGIPFGGASLNFARPSKYEGPALPVKTWFEVLAESSLLATGSMGGPDPSASYVVRIGSVVNEEELVDDESYAEVVEDMREECGKYGSVTGIEIPRNGAPGTGYVFVRYSTKEQSAKAKSAFGSRTFDGRQVETIYISESDFDQRRF